MSALTARSWGTVMVLVVGTAGMGFAATSQQNCDKTRMNAWKTYVSCVEAKVAKDAFGTTVNQFVGFAKCRHTYFKKWASFQTKGSLAGSACVGSRFTDNGDGTVTDNLTTLVWEQKTDDDSVHDKDNLYTWATGTYLENGTAFTTLLATLNGGGDSPRPTTGGYRRSRSCRPLRMTSRAVECEMDRRVSARRRRALTRLWVRLSRAPTGPRPATFPIRQARGRSISAAATWGSTTRRTPVTCARSAAVSERGARSPCCWRRDGGGRYAGSAAVAHRIHPLPERYPLTRTGDPHDAGRRRRIRWRGHQRHPDIVSRIDVKGDDDSIPFPFDNPACGRFNRRLPLGIQP